MSNKNTKDKEPNGTDAISDIIARYSVVDKDGIEMPLRYDGQHRTYEQAKRMVDSLNRHGECNPYNMIKI